MPAKDFSGKTVKLAKDIDLSKLCGAESGSLDADRNFCTTESFKGTFDGRGHSIRGLYVDLQKLQDRRSYAGLFGVASDAVICDLTIREF